MERATALIERCGQFVRASREELGLTQERFAKRCGLSIKHLGDLERGIADPSLSTLDAVARGIQMDLDRMLGEVIAPARDERGHERPMLDLRRLLQVQEALSVLHDYIGQLVVYSRRTAGETEQGEYRRRTRDRDE